jgi:ribosomal protein S18 acetylase RimI-like enzyme
VPAGFELLRPETQQELLDVRSVQHEAYGELEPAQPVDAERLAENMRIGGMAVLARLRDTREAVGAGEYTAPLDGLTEITSIAVRSAFRRRAASPPP